jgi:RNA polymerase sigma factor (sigma-70 family)
VTSGPAILLDHIHRVFAPLAGQPDDELLRLFAAGGPASGAAFEVLVRRHGPLVLRACRARLRDAHAADDCFQATFLVLARRAAGLRLRRSLALWLFEVARRVSAQAAYAAARRRRHECAAAADEAVKARDGLWPDEVALLHDEVRRLPRRMREAVVLCDLEGLTYQDAAERLGLSHATVRGRLARARGRLRQRLTRLGFGPDAALVAVPLAVPQVLTKATVRSALAVAAGTASGFVPEAVLLLTNGGLPSMFLTKVKLAGLSALTAGVLVAGALTLSAQAPTPAEPPARVAANQVLYEFSYAPPDPAERLAELARRAKGQHEGGDDGAALQSLAEAEETLRQWQSHVRQARDASRDRDEALLALKMQLDQAVDEREQLRRQVADLTAARQRALQQAGALPQPQQGATAKQAPPRAGDVESRLSEVEKKLDRLLKALERQPQPEAPQRTPPRGS